jgi:hypothetical protein
MVRDKFLKEISRIRDRAIKESSKQHSNPFLPELIEYLNLMSEIISIGPTHPRYSSFEREKILGGFGRIVTENYRFLNSSLGKKMIAVSENFLKVNDRTERD